MYKIAAVLALGLALLACSTTRDGMKLGFGGTPSGSEVQKVRDQLEQNAQSSTAKKLAAGALTPEGKAGMLLVGTVGPLRKVEGDNLHRFYASYLKDADKWHPGQAAVVSEASFVAQIGGWATLETFSIPGVITLRQPALIRVQDLGAISFPGTLTSFLVSATGDLVGARSNEDGALIVERVLCKDADADYRACAAQFEKGRFDRNTGAELDRSMQPKAGGVQIDPTTFKVTHRAG